MFSKNNYKERLRKMEM